MSEPQPQPLLAEFSVVWTDENLQDHEATLIFQTTGEGLIADLFCQGEVVQTFARTAQEFVEDLMQ
jgi:hypothetical protein